MTNHLVDVLVQNKIDMLVFGHNKGMKTGVNYPPHAQSVHYPHPHLRGGGF